MTIVCALRAGPAVYIGSDSRMVAGTYLFPAPVEKWREIDGWWVGFAGSWRLDALMRLRKPELGDDPYQAVEALHRLAIVDGWTPIHNEEPGPRRHDMQTIVVSPDLHVYEAGTTGSPVDMGEEFAAVGSGCEFAQGAAHALRLSSPEDRARGAIDAAMKYDVSCGGPVFLRKLIRVDTVRDSIVDGSRLTEPDILRLVPRI